MPRTSATQDLQKKLARLFDPEKDDKPDALGPENVDDDGEVIPSDHHDAQPAGGL